ncbi:MAG TPA: hypothetical protein VHD55_01950 [Candidatus Paceibacterota bacterium]|nr:hypothetical protein [Candidatus Paceibacterota bacterium]
MVALAPPERRPLSKIRVFFALIGLIGMTLVILGGAALALDGLGMFFIHHLPADRAAGITGMGIILVAMAMGVFNLLRRKIKGPAG